MVVFTNTGSEYVADLIKQNVRVVALGTGTAPEDPQNGSLANEVYRQSAGASNISVYDDPNQSAVLYQLSIKGGTQIDGGTDITEMGLFGDASGDATAETLVVRSVSGVTEITSGKFSIFQIRVPVQRPSGGGGA